MTEMTPPRDTQQFMKLEFKAFRQVLASSGHRALCVIAGEQQWCREMVAAVDLTTTAIADILLIAETDAGMAGRVSELTVISRKHVHKVLGSEYSNVIYDAHEGLCPNAVAAAAGTIKAGGLFIMLAPSLDDWPSFNDPEYKKITVYPTPAEELNGSFLSWWTRQILSAPSALIWPQGSAEPVVRSSDGASVSMLSQHLLDVGHASSVQEDTRLLSSKTVSVIEQRPGLNDQFDDAVLALCRTYDQRLAVQSVQKVALGHRNRPLVLSADRGRGKSLAMGLGLGSVVGGRLSHPKQSQQSYQVLVVAPSIDATVSFFRGLEMSLAALNLAWDIGSSGVLGDYSIKSLIKPVMQSEPNHAPHQINYVNPESLSESWPSADLVFVDEAAAFPVQVLEQIATRYSRVCFASTVNGYEGSGRGFELRFEPKLAKLKPQWRRLQLLEPIRWKSGDPLEQWIAAACLMKPFSMPQADKFEKNIDAATKTSLSPQVAATLSHISKANSVHYKLLCAKDLVEAPHLLEQIFDLFVAAHYRTSPADARSMLDGPNIHVFVAYTGGHADGSRLVLLGAVLFAEEGLLEDLAADINSAKRRIHGHLTPQALTQYCGFSEALKHRSWRVIRIAVAPKLQCRGVGSGLVSALKNLATDAQLDYLSTSYSVSSEVLNFWQKNDFEMARFSLRKETSSGSYSALMLHPINSELLPFCDQVRQQFEHLFLQQLRRTLSALDPAIACRVLVRQSAKGTNFSAHDRALLASFAAGEKLVEVCWLALERLCLFLCAENRWESELALNIDDVHLLLGLTLQCKPIKAVVDESQLLGKAALIKKLGMLVAQSMPLVSTAKHS